MYSPLVALLSSVLGKLESPVLLDRKTGSASSAWADGYGTGDELTQAPRKLRITAPYVISAEASEQRTHGQSWARIARRPERAGHSRNVWREARKSSDGTPPASYTKLAVRAVYAVNTAEAAYGTVPGVGRGGKDKRWGEMAGQGVSREMTAVVPLTCRGRGEDRASAMIEADSRTHLRDPR